MRMPGKALLKLRAKGSIQPSVRGRREEDSVGTRERGDRLQAPPILELPSGPST